MAWRVWREVHVPACVHHPGGTVARTELPWQGWLAMNVHCCQGKEWLAGLTLAAVHFMPRLTRPEEFFT